MTRIAPVVTQGSNIALWFDAGKLQIKPGCDVIVSTARGTEYGTLKDEIFEANKKQLKNLKSDLQPVIRIANEEDKAQNLKMIQKGKDALPIFREIAATTNEQMMCVKVAYLFDEKKAVFYFTAPERQDFRELIKKLSSKFSVRVDMRQINEREKSSMVGGIGNCGQEICCAKIGRCPKHVSIKMAKCQGLSLNPENISGMCGKLLCCLDYEFDQYEEFTKKAPKIKGKIATPDGEAIVTNLNMPKNSVELALEGETTKRLSVSLEDIIIDKKIAKQKNQNTNDNIRPNKIDQKAWNKAKEDNNTVSLDSVYVSTNLEDSEKLATGMVTTLPNVKNKTNATGRHEVLDERKPRERRNRRTKAGKTFKSGASVNVYEQDNATKSRRRSRTISANGSGANKSESNTEKKKSNTRPGRNSSGLRRRNRRNRKSNSDSRNK